MNSASEQWFLTNFGRDKTDQFECLENRSKQLEKQQGSRHETKPIVFSTHHLFLQRYFLASSFSLGGALVAECFAISKETKMMSLFHPEKN